MGTTAYIEQSIPFPKDGKQCTFDIDTCFHNKIEDIVIRISIGVIIQILCSYVTLPLYALVTQMGSTLSSTIFDVRVAELNQWCTIRWIFSSAIYAEDCIFEDPTIRFRGKELYSCNLKLLVPFFDSPSIGLENVEKESILLDLLRVISHHRARLATPIRTVQQIYGEADLENVPFAGLVSGLVGFQINQNKRPVMSFRICSSLFNVKHGNFLNFCQTF